MIYILVLYRLLSAGGGLTRDPRRRLHIRRSHLRMKKLICAAMAAVLLLFPAAQCAAAGSGGSYSVVPPSGKDGLLHAPDGEKIFDDIFKEFNL